jgi:hypothetical protein
MFIYPVTENEVEGVTTSLKGNFSTGFDKTAAFLVKQSIHYIKKNHQSIFLILLLIHEFSQMR